MSAELGYCAVDGCPNRATRTLELGKGSLRQPVAWICDAHDNELGQPGWVLRTSSSSQPTLFPPEADIPPF